MAKILFGKVFLVLVFGHFFCPFLKTQNTFLKKPKVCDHILILWSGHKYFNANFVTIIFFYKYLKTFSFVNICQYLAIKNLQKLAKNISVNLVTIIPCERVLTRHIF